MTHPAADPAPGVYVSLDDLLRLRHRVRSVSFLPRQPVRSLLSGRHAAKVRGRGLDFDEIRGYLPGDDVRTIDWRVTARTGKTHVRVFTEERDRPAVFVVDQRLLMFFGTRRSFKSFVAAELAAAGAWRVLDVGDRAGAVVFDDREAVEVKPHRSRRTVMRILDVLVAKNRALCADDPTPPNRGMLDRALRGVERWVSHDYLIAVLSDFDGATEETARLLSRMARHNDVVAVPVWDPSTTELPERGRLVVSDHELQVELDLGRVRRRLLESADRRLGAVLAWQRDFGVPVLPVTTAEDGVDQLRRLLGARR